MLDDPRGVVVIIKQKKDETIIRESVDINRQQIIEIGSCT